MPQPRQASSRRRPNLSETVTLTARAPKHTRVAPVPVIDIRDESVFTSNRWRPEFRAPTGRRELMYNSGWRLESIEDVRPIDWYTGEYLPVDLGSVVSCDFCSEKHDIYYHVVNDRTGERKSVGVEHCAPACGGWTPSKRELKATRRELARSMEASRAAALDAFASELAERVCDDAHRAGNDPRGLGWVGDAIRRLDQSPAGEFRDQVRSKAEQILRVLARRKTASAST
jgi:hypothetical protein